MPKAPKAPKWTVTRQHQWPDGKDIVEISKGGRDYTNPDALASKYPGEFEEFTDPREAAKTAIAIAQAWQKDKPDLTILIDHGATGGMTMPFDGMPISEESTVKAITEWAEEAYEELEKCEQCGEPLGEERYGNADTGEYDCCSEYCAEKRHFSSNEEEDHNEPELEEK